MGRLTIQGTRFVDEHGREVILHGLNVLCRGRETGHFYPDFEKAFSWFRKAGFNLLRFGIFWDAAEPEPGVIDEAYLQKVKSIFRLAEQYGIFIMVDMHQDLFAAKYIDGAPDWACLDEGLYHPENCALWYQAYLESDAIIWAADNFWANKPAADGVGLLDHYEHMWERIAEVFSDGDNVIGLEPMNEPFMGSVARKAFGEAAMKAMQKNPAFNLTDPSTYQPEEQAEFMGAVAQCFLEWDRTVLMDFYRRIARAICKTSTLPLITGGNIYCSTNLPTGIEKVEGIGQIFAPHGYDTVVDSDNYQNYSMENVARLYEHKKQAADRLGLPTIASEWGAFPSRDFTNDLIRFMNGILEKNLWGSAYCEYRPGMEHDPNFAALCRAYPMAVSGELTAYHYDEAAHSFTMQLNAKAGTNRIYLPFVPEKAEANLPFSYKAEQAEAGGETAYLELEILQDGLCHVFIQ